MPNISRGSSVGGLMRYLVGPGRGNVHTNPHLVAGDPAVMAWSAGAEHPGVELGGAAAGAIARVIDHPRKAFGVDVPGGHTWHCSLSLRADEGQLTDEKWAAIAHDFVRGMGFDGSDGKAPCRWVAVHHGLSAGRNGQPGNDHVHIALSLVREDGTKASVWRDQPRAQQVARDLERKYGLQVVESREHGRGTRGLSRAELERAERLRLAEPERRTLARMVRGCATAAGDEAEFVRRLRAAGLAPRPYFAAGSGESVVSGYSVGRRAAPGERLFRLGGTNLAKDLSLPRLRESMGWPDTPGSAAAAVGEWVAARQDRAPRTPVGGVRWDPGVARAYTEEVGALREWLRSVPVTEAVTWAAAARQIGGVFAEWSRTVEGDRPGPLAEAADALAVAGERAGWADHPVRAVPRVRGAAAFAAVAGRSASGETALLLRVLSNAAKAIRDREEAAGELALAGRVEVVMRERLAAVRAAQPPLELPPAAPQRGWVPGAVPAAVARRQAQRTGSERGVER